ncbi:DUF1697 domain-containing protein [Euzebya sp.]|uniref:DUF1697 domain-containing protein n=1 Tax=Euzebya sp. TaxID=1971409 RepID=UPI003515E9DF
MPRLTAFLRAINVGGRRVTNDDLRRVATDAGFADPATFLASGNLVVDAGDRSPDQATRALETALEEGLGFASEVFIRTAEEIEAIVGADVFEPPAVEAAVAAPQVILLREPLDGPGAEAVTALSTAADRLAVLDREILWLPRDGVGRAALDWRSLDPLIGVTTVRSRNTLARIHAKYLSG